MQKVTLVTSGKGGVGKTTVTANLGAGIAMAGYKTLLMDMDLGLRNLDLVLGLENRVIYTLTDVISGRCRIRQSLVRDKRYSNLYLLAASQTANKDSVEPEQIMKLVGMLKDEFDYILLDCPAGIERGFENCIGACDSALVVVNPEVSSVRDADRVIGLLEQAGISNKPLIVNRYRADLSKKHKVLTPEDIGDLLGEPILGTIPESDAIVLSTNKGMPVVGERGALSRAYARLAADFIGQGNAGAETEEEKKGLFAKLASFL